MSGEGPNIGMLQAMDSHQDQQGVGEEEKSGFGLGHSDSIATIVYGMKWMFSFHEGAIAAYNHVLEGLISGSSLVTLFGKSGNMFGIKFFEKLAEFFSGGVEEDGGVPQEGDVHVHDEDRPDDYPHASDEMNYSAGGLHGARDYGDYHGQSFDPGPSPHVGDDHGHGREMGG
ncbi:MAG: hypothetical protein PV340_05770 [Wolbachia sp.]|nr:hypothetical protein [Wolbachia sp.]MDD9335894.1 hypothetical protein [Wolbachia sp.]